MPAPRPALLQRCGTFPALGAAAGASAVHGAHRGVTDPCPTVTLPTQPCSDPLWQKQVLHPFSTSIFLSLVLLRSQACRAHGQLLHFRVKPL